MCGIFGMINQNEEPVLREELEQATDIIKHRGPDDKGYFCKDALGFGHRRLSIIDLTQKGKQPMHYLDRYTLIYNGEIYNYIELKAVLVENGYQFKSETDTEVIIAAYDFWGADCLSKFNGMWSFALLDQKENIVFCARDRFGIKPFYYTQIEDKFCFASEIKQFTVIDGWKAKLNKLRAYEFLTLGYHEHTDETFFKHVFQLRPGHLLTYNLSNHQFKISNYYDIRKQKNKFTKQSLSEAIESFKALLKNAVRIRLRSHVENGSALSGGLDSSSIVCIMDKLNSTKNKKIQTVSAVFPGHKVDEFAYVKEVSKKTNLHTHTVHPNFKTIIENLNKTIWHQDEPFGSSSVLAQQAVFKQAQLNDITVMLDGQGADEILAGYKKFYYPFFKKKIRKNPIEGVKQVLMFFALHSIPIRKIISRVLDFRKKKSDQKYNWLKETFIPDGDLLFPRSAENSIQDISINTLTEVGLSILLHYEDRNSMSASVESRLPFLDYRIVEFCISLPDDYKIHNAKRKFILREAMKDLLPKKIYTRYDKIGFATPQQKWIEENQSFFQQKRKEALARCDGIFNDKILAIKDDTLIWRIISFSEWMKIFKVEID